MQITPEQAERRIVALVHGIEALRASSAHDRETRIEELRAEIRNLKQITGQRQITGVYGHVVRKE